MNPITAQLAEAELRLDAIRGYLQERFVAMIDRCPRLIEEIEVATDAAPKTWAAQGEVIARILAAEAATLPEGPLQWLALDLLNVGDSGFWTEFAKAYGA